MRIWDVPVQALCRQHLLGEHRELHALWNVLTRGRTGYANHPETRRWRGRLAALYARHEQQVAEMVARGYTHRSPLDPVHATGSGEQTAYVDTPDRQRQLLAAKGCGCRWAGTDTEGPG